MGKFSAITEFTRNGFAVVQHDRAVNLDALETQLNLQGEFLFDVLSKYLEDGVITALEFSVNSLDMSVSFHEGFIRVQFSNANKEIFKNPDFLKALIDRKIGMDIVRTSEHSKLVLPTISLSAEESARVLPGFGVFASSAHQMLSGVGITEDMTRQAHMDGDTLRMAFCFYQPGGAVNGHKRAEHYDRIYDGVNASVQISELPRTWLVGPSASELRTVKQYRGTEILLDGIGKTEDGSRTLNHFPLVGSDSSLSFLISLSGKIARIHLEDLGIDYDDPLRELDSNFLHL